MVDRVPRLRLRLGGATTHTDTYNLLFGFRVYGTVSRDLTPSFNSFARRRLVWKTDVMLCLAWAEEGRYRTRAGQGRQRPRSRRLFDLWIAIILSTAAWHDFFICVLLAVP